MTDFSLQKSFGLMARTTPFLVFRMAVYFGIACAYVIVTGTGAGIGWGIGGFGDDDFRAGATFWGGAAGFGLTAGVIYLLREYILYTVKAGHIAVMVEMIDGRPLPEGRGQIAHATTVVKERFAETSVLFAIDQLVKGVLAAITGLLQGVANFLPIPGVQQIMGIVRAFLRIAVGLVDEVILAHAIRTRSTNPWDSARTALVLYGQNAGRMMRNAAVLTLIVWGLSLLVFVVMLAPAAAVVYLIPGAWSAGGVVFALIFAWAVKAALIEPFAVACMMQAFFKVTDGQVPNPAWETKLDGVSDKFRKMGAGAMGWKGAPTAPVGQDLGMRA
ncbi:MULTISPECIES: hypothetical protein [unclassified Yoonia]|uniref:hypothetical protein n=1 Tax=unclassified Yoonia TaxID=2629118 RepID=UPI002AFFD536|nr:MULTISPECIES: hypothetical protein [unclassified Yoonia]